MTSLRTATLVGLVGALTMLMIGGAAAADLHHRHLRHVRHDYAPDPPVVPLGYAYGGYQRAYPPGYGYVVPGQGYNGTGYDGPGFGFPGY